MTETATSEKQRGLFRWLWKGYLSQHWPLIAIAMILMAIEGSMMGLLSYMMKPMFDTVFVEGSRSAMYWVGAGLFGIFLTRAITSLGQKTLLTRIGAQVQFAIQTNLLRHAMQLDTLFHQANPPGSMIERITGDTLKIGTVSTIVISGLGRDTVALASLMAVVLWIDWQWTLVALIGTPILVLPSLFAQAYVRRTTHSSRIIAGQMTTRLDEIFHGISAIKLNALERYQARRHGDLGAKRVKAEVQAGFGQALIPSLVDVMTGIGFCGVLIYGGTEIIDGTKTIGEFMSFFTAMSLAFEPLRRLGQINGHWQSAAVSIRRVCDLLATEPRMKSPASPVSVPQVQGDIVFDQVKLGFGESLVLRGTSFVAKAGETTALVGASGAGKSTIFNALTRLVEPSSGTISLAGTPIEKFELADLRAQISVVTQDALLFDETLEENILLGRENVSEKLIQDVMNAAHITDFVSKLPEGIMTPVGPRGSALSGGQRQRVAIARALLRDTPILLLDEATSALDAHSEAVVQGALDQLSTGRTTLVIAHRLSTIRRADKIVVMDRGEVVEQGSHDALLAKGGPYAQLHALQFKTKDTA